MSDSFRLLLLRAVTSSTNDNNNKCINDSDENELYKKKPNELYKKKPNELPLLHISCESPSFNGERGEADGQSYVLTPNEDTQDASRSPDYCDGIIHCDSGIESFQTSPRDGVSPITSSSNDSYRRPSWAVCEKSASLHPHDARTIHLQMIKQECSIDEGENNTLELNELTFVKDHPAVATSTTAATPSSCGSPELSLCDYVEPLTVEQHCSSLHDSPQPSTSKPYPVFIPGRNDKKRWPASNEMGDDRSMSGDSYSDVSCCSDYSHTNRNNSWSSIYDATGIHHGVSNLSLQSIGVSNHLNVEALNKSSLHQYYVTVTSQSNSRPPSVISRLSGQSYCDEPFRKLTFTQTLAFPTLAPKELGHHKRTDIHIETERSLNRFAFAITVLVLVLVSALVIGVLFKFLNAHQ